MKHSKGEVEIKTPIERIDSYLAEHSGYSRSFVQSQITLGKVRVNQTLPKKPSLSLNPGDLLTYEFELLSRPIQALEPHAGPLSVLYEDESLIVLNKPQGLVVHPSLGHETDSIVHRLLHYLRHDTTFQRLNEWRPGIVHRLDGGTSGLLLVAKTQSSLEDLALQFKNRQTHKTYEALAWGELADSGRFESPIGRHFKYRQKMSSRTRHGRAALTLFSTLNRMGPISHLQLHPHTGRTHQLRVHLSEAGTPIVGDFLYGKVTLHQRIEFFSSSFGEFLNQVSFPFLHAKTLRFTHPLSKAPFAISAPRPEIFDRALNILNTP